MDKKKIKRERAKVKIMEAVASCALAQDYLSLERMFSRLAQGTNFDEAVALMFGDLLVTASDAEIELTRRVADFVLAYPARAPWRG